MRIVQCVTLASSDGAFGGPLAVAIEQCRELAALGHDVTLLGAWDGELRLEVPGVRVVLARAVRIPGSGFNGVFAPAILRWLRQHRTEVDVVHVHLGRHLLDLAVSRVAQRLSIPVIAQTHGMVMPDGRLTVKMLDAIWTRGVLNRAAAVLVLSEDERAGILSVQPKATVRAVRNGISPVENPAPVTASGQEVLFLSRLHPRKRVMAFALAAEMIAKDYSSARFTAIGPDEGDLDQLQEFIALRPEVPLRYGGSISPGSGSSRIARADVFVLPSEGEVFPMALLEAMAAGTPIVMASDCAIAPTLADAGAAIVTDGTPEALATAVRELLSDGSLRRRMSAAGRRLVDQELGARAVAKDLEDLYSTSTKSRQRIIWITNQAAPYRVPLWTEIAEQASLEVWLLESDSSVKRDSNNRGDDWVTSDQDVQFTYKTIPTLALRRGEARHYLSGWLPIYRHSGIDAVLIGGWDSPAYWLAALAARLAGVRRIGFYESHARSQRHVRGPAAWARRRFLRSLDGVVVPGVAARDALLTQGLSPERLHMGFNAVDVTQINREAKRRREETTQACLGVGLRLIVASQLIERKNVAAVIAALARPGVETATLTIVGDGPLAADLGLQAKRLGVAQRVTFLGLIPGSQMPAVLADHDVLIHIPTEEVWGLVVNEALAAGLHVVVSDVAGVASSVADMRGVTVVPPTTDSLVAAILAWERPAPISQPEILSFGPKEFASVFLGALRRPAEEHR